MTKLREGFVLRLRESLLEGIRRREAVLGQMLVQEAVKLDQVRLMVLASDAGASTATKFRLNAERKGLPLVSPFTGSEMGQLVGREFLSLIGIKNQGLALKIMEDQRRFRALEDDGG